MIKHVFTGNLNSEIQSNPPFPGKERHLLRAQLARISHATQLIPKGMLETDEDTNEIKFAEDFVMPGTEDLKSTETWGNLHGEILKCGRTSHFAPVGMEEDALAEYMDAQQEKDPKLEEQFRAINEQKPMTGLEFAWLSKVVGDQQQYNLLPPKEGTTSYAVNVLKSLRWPGAMTVSKGGKFTFVYTGYGIKKGDPSLNPTEPPEVQKDPVDQDEEPEPTPLTEPVAPAEEQDNEQKGSDEEQDE